MTTQAVTFTPESVRDILLAAGLIEHNARWKVPGFVIDDRSNTPQHEIWVRRVGETPDTVVIYHEAVYEDALLDAGFRGIVRNGYVAITGIREDW